MSDQRSADSRSNIFTRVAKSVKKQFSNSAKQFSVKDVCSREKVLHRGYLRKKNTSKVMGKAMEHMNMKWGIFYILVTEKAMYYFKSDTSSSCVGKFSLFGYNVVKRAVADTHTKWPEHALVIQHASEDPELNKDYYFAATHSDECRAWLVQIRKALMAANSQLVPGYKRARVDSASTISELEDPIYPSHEFRSDKSAYIDEEGDVESGDDDYECIPEPDDSPPPPRPKKAVSTLSSSSYIEIEESSRTESRRMPLPPVPDDASYQYNPTVQASSPNKPLFLNVDSPANTVLSELMVKQQQIRSVADTAPRNTAPGLPTQAALKPPVSRKPVQLVKPRVQPERIFWNGGKDEGNKIIKDSQAGVFLVRAGSSGGQLVMVIAGGESDAHSVRINNYADGCMGLKAEATAPTDERFKAVQDMVKHYKSHEIHLRNGTVQIRLTSPHTQCTASLE